jgi:hypothetical protein
VKSNSYLIGKESKPAVFKSAIVLFVSEPAGTVTAHLSPRCSIEGVKPEFVSREARA